MRAHAPGYPVLPSPGSLRGQNFFVGNGEPLPNEGQVNLRFSARDEAGEKRPERRDASSAPLAKWEFRATRHSHNCPVFCIWYVCSVRVLRVRKITES